MKWSGLDTLETFSFDCFAQCILIDSGNFNYVVHFNAFINNFYSKYNDLMFVSV